MTPAKSRSWFTRFSKATARATGQPITFASACLLIVVWAVTGPLFHFSDTWQLVVNTGTTVITFLMVFLIQSTQNRDAEAVHIKLDELLRVTAGAHNVLLDLEELEEHELEKLRDAYCALAEKARHGRSGGRSESGVPDIEDIAKIELDAGSSKAKGKRRGK
ncbi:MAG TPA: low affinity iron permease family protein [Steroidobacteraceae bacterium]|nr:low affinity iron permease family protein [Steroidobacteraceae bacterium]